MERFDPWAEINKNLADLGKLTGGKALLMADAIAGHQASALYHMAAALLSLALVMEKLNAAKSDQEGT